MASYRRIAFRVLFHRHCPCKCWSIPASFHRQGPGNPIVSGCTGILKTDGSVALPATCSAKMMYANTRCQAACSPANPAWRVALRRFLLVNPNAITCDTTQFCNWYCHSGWPRVLHDLVDWTNFSLAKPSIWPDWINCILRLLMYMEIMHLPMLN